MNDLCARKSDVTCFPCVNLTGYRSSITRIGGFVATEKLLGKLNTMSWATQSGLH